MKDIVIAGYCRSPFTPAHKGQLTRMRPDDLVAQTVKGLLKKTQVPVGDIEDLILGCAFPEAEQGFNMARLVVFLAGLPQSVARHYGQPILWIIHASDSYGGRRNPNERWRGFYLCRCGINDPSSNDGI